MICQQFSNGISYGTVKIMCDDSTSFDEADSHSATEADNWIENVYDLDED